LLEYVSNEYGLDDHGSSVDVDSMFSGTKCPNTADPQLLANGTWIGPLCYQC
jgi:hypothetical protein